MNLRSTLLLFALVTPSQPCAPPEAFVERQMRGWTVRVHPKLAQKGNVLGAEVLELLDHKLFDVTRVVPATALAKLKQVTIWMDLDDERVPGGVYHPSVEWLEKNDYNHEFARCVQFGNAQNFIAWSFDQPWMVLHELAHAYHHQVLDYSNTSVAKAFEAASASGEYATILRCNGSREAAYAMNNSQEYFAELSEAYFGVNDFYPFVKAEVREFDPRGFAMLKEVWGE